MARNKTADDVNDLQGQDDDAGDAAAVRAFQGRMADIVARAVAAEREACAAIAGKNTEPLQGPTHGAWERGYIAGRAQAAVEIRNRSNTSK